MFLLTPSPSPSASLPLQQTRQGMRANPLLPSVDLYCNDFWPEKVVVKLEARDRTTPGRFERKHVCLRLKGPSCQERRQDSWLLPWIMSLPLVLLKQSKRRNQEKLKDQVCVVGLSSMRSTRGCYSTEICVQDHRVHCSYSLLFTCLLCENRFFQAIWLTNLKQWFNYRVSFTKKVKLRRTDITKWNSAGISGKPFQEKIKGKDMQGRDLSFSFKKNWKDSPHPFSWQMMTRREFLQKVKSSSTLRKRKGSKK